MAADLNRFRTLAVMCSSFVVAGLLTENASADVIRADVNQTRPTEPQGVLEIYYDPLDVFTATQIYFEVTHDSNWGIYAFDTSPTGGFFDVQAEQWDLTGDGTWGEISNGVPTLPPPPNLMTDEIRIVNDGFESAVYYADHGRLDVSWDNIVIEVSEPSSAWMLLVIGIVLTPFALRRR